MGLAAVQRSGGERDGNKCGNALRKCGIRRATPRPGQGRGPRFDPWSAYHENAELQSGFLAEPLDDTENATESIVRVFGEFSRAPAHRPSA
jgi:hypothetical protein